MVTARASIAVFDRCERKPITPDAKPNSDFCNRTDISSRIKNTNAEPSIVPNSGINSPMINVVVIIEYKDIWA